MRNPYTPHHIVVCCDGTWCGADTGTRGNIQVIADGFASQGQHAYVHTRDGEPVYNSYTNTDICYFKGVGLDGLEDLAKEGKQLPPGLGLLGGFGDTLLYIANGIIANDLPERCKEAYGFIMDKYKGPGVSRIWLFGFSRGAYTVRAVAGMINNCGIHMPVAADDPAARRAALQKVWNLFRSNEAADSPNGSNAKDFRASHSWRRGDAPPIAFMGLLDTVGAEGIPRIKPQDDPASAFTYAYSFRDVVVSSEVQHVFQVAATHDRLAPFEACPVRRSSKMSGDAADSSSGHYQGVEFSLQEVWYPGAHYDIGRQDFVLSNQPITNTLFRVLNPLRTDVKCTPELADYPLLGRALPAHGGPAPPPRLIGVPSNSSSSSSTNNDSFPGGSSSSSTNSVSSSELCLVAQVNKIRPGMLPPADDDSAWEHLVAGNFADINRHRSRISKQQQLGKMSLRDLDLLKPLWHSHSAIMMFAVKAGTQLMLPWFWLLQKLTAGLPLPLFQTAYTIDAETKILAPVVKVLAALLDTQPELLLRDRTIPLPTAADKYLPVGRAVFFPVPRDNGSFDSYKPGGRPGEWFMSKAYHTYMYECIYDQHMHGSSTESSSVAGAAAAGAMLGALAPHAALTTHETSCGDQQRMQSSAKSSSTAEAAATAAAAAAAAAVKGALAEPAMSQDNLSAWSGLTAASFSIWLAARKSGLLLLSGAWLFEQVPAEQQQLYAKAMAEQGYLQVAEGADHLLLMSPHGLQSLRQLLQEAELQAMHAIYSSPHGDGGDEVKQSGVSGALHDSSGLPCLSPGEAAQQGQSQSSSGARQVVANATAAAADASAQPLLPVETCFRLALPSSDRWDRGLPESRISNSDASDTNADDGAVLEVVFMREMPDCTLKVDVSMQACIKQEGKDTLLGFKLVHIVANVQATGLSSSSSSNGGASSSSGGKGGSGSSFWPTKQKGIKLGFMDKVWLSLEVQRQDGSACLCTVNKNRDVYDVEMGKVQNDYRYRYKEHNFNSSLEVGLVPKFTLGWDTAFKLSPGSAGAVEVPLVTVETNSQARVPTSFGRGSHPCTVVLMRQPRNTLLCDKALSLGYIDSRPGNQPGDVLCYQVRVPDDCLSNGHLLADKLVVKLAVCAVGGLLTTNPPKVLHNAQEVEVQGNFATSLLDGRIVQLSPLMPLQETPWPGCKLHPPA